MYGEDFEHEKLRVSESVGLAFHGLDLVVGALQRAGGDGMPKVSQEPRSVLIERRGQAPEVFADAGFSDDDPGIEHRDALGITDSFRPLRETALHRAEVVKVFNTG